MRNKFYVEWSRSRITNDVVSADRWDLDITTEAGHKFMEVVNDVGRMVEAMCGGHLLQISIGSVSRIALIFPNIFVQKGSNVSCIGQIASWFHRL